MLEEMKMIRKTIGNARSRVGHLLSDSYSRGTRSYIYASYSFGDRDIFSRTSVEHYGYTHAFCWEECLKDSL